MPYTKCPKCRKVQRISPKLLHTDIGCMGQRCGTVFKAESYRLHSGPLSRIVFWFVIGFAVFMLARWLWLHGVWIIEHYS